MKKIWIALIMSIIATLHTAPAQANGITAVVLPNPIGLPEIALVLGLLGFALWKRSWIRVVLSLGVIIWGAFSLPYDAKIAGPLVAAGTLLFIMGIMNIVSAHRTQEA